MTGTPVGTGAGPAIADSHCAHGSDAIEVPPMDPTT